jgi:hypothetical protein
MAYDSNMEVIHMNAYNGAATSAAGATAATTTFARATVLRACVVEDFNVIIGGTGDTSTSGAYTFVLQKSVDGTGAASAIGTASNTGLTHINNTVIDGAVTVTSMDAGDDLVLVSGAGTILPAGSVTIAGADVLVARGDVEVI